MAHILIVEDDRALARGIELALREGERCFTACHNLAAARAALREAAYSLMILDVSLPDGSGFDFCAEVRPSFAAPILFLTANDTEMDIVTGLELGGDDYMTKPFSLSVLRARVGALLRRGGAARRQAVVAGDLSLDFERLLFTKGSAPLELSKTELRLLHLLATNPGQTIPRGRLLEYIWADGGEFVDENALAVAISRLRAKLGDDSAAQGIIKTVRGVGYTWVAAP